jgi:hypothetical protein
MTAMPPDTALERITACAAELARRCARTLADIAAFMGALGAQAALDAAIAGVA